MTRYHYRKLSRQELRFLIAPVIEKKDILQTTSSFLMSLMPVPILLHGDALDACPRASYLHTLGQPRPRHAMNTSIPYRDMDHR